MAILLNLVKSCIDILGNIVDGHWHNKWQKPTIFGHCDEYRFEDVPGPTRRPSFVLVQLFSDRDCPSSTKDS